MNVHSVSTTIDEWYELIEIKLVKNGYILVFNEK